jgi:peptide-methionine (S)-S-oxide reductase
MIRFVVVLLLAMTGMAQAKTEKAIFAGGCFWCVESDFEKVEGVKGVVSGYTGGDLENPTYRDHEGHYEAVEISFDPAKVSYADLVAMFLRSVDVTDAGGQFCDRGPAYRTAIFALDAGQKAAAEAAVSQAAADLGQAVVTPVLDAGRFWVAEDYHQDYYKGTNYVLTRAGPKMQKNAYLFYREGCGRDARVKEIWGKAAAFAH